MNSVAGNAESRTVFGPTREVAGNAANPPSGSGMQQARSICEGASRQGGAKPRRRNATGRLAAIGRRALGPWSGRRGCRSAGREGSGRTPREEGTPGPEHGERALKEGPSSEARQPARQQRAGRQGDLERPRRPDLATGQGQGGSGESQRPATGPSGDRIARFGIRASNSTSTSTRAGIAQAVHSNRCGKL